METYKETILRYRVYKKRYNEEDNPKKLVAYDQPFNLKGCREICE